MKRIVLAAMAALLLAGCETATPYAPAAPGSHQGYSEQRLDQNRWRVSFAGNSVTSRETVEDYLLYRAAELTTQQGYDWFETAQRSTDRKTTVEGVGPGPYGPYVPFWHPYWRYYRAGAWGPWGDPFWGGGYEQIDRFQATAEILMGHGKKPDGDTRAFDAREVMANVGPKVVRPQPKS